MKSRSSVLCFVFCSIVATRTLATGPETTNTTSHKIDVTKHIGLKGVGYKITIDGKPTIDGNKYYNLKQEGASMEHILAYAHKTPLVFHATALKFTKSMLLCPGSGVGDVVEAVIESGTNQHMLCLTREPEEGDIQLFVAFDPATIH